MFFFKRWSTLFESYKPPEIIELDFKLYHNIISTYEKLLKIGKKNQVVVQFAYYKMRKLYIYLLAVMNYMNLYKKCVVYHLET